MDVTEPRGTPLGTIMLVHGMTVLGNRDERLVVLGNALCLSRVSCRRSRFPRIRSLTISELQIHRIGAAIEAVLNQPALAPSGRISLLALLFGRVVTVCRNPASSRRSGRCRVCDRCLQSCGIGDPVLAGRTQRRPLWSLYRIKKLLAATDLAQETYLLDSLDAAIQENINASRRERGATETDVLGQPALADVLLQQSDEQRELSLRLFNDSSFRLALLDQASSALAHEFHALDVGNRLNALKARVFCYMAAMIG